MSTPTQAELIKLTRDLLYALRHARRSMSPSDPNTRSVDAAIAKARAMGVSV